MASLDDNNPTSGACERAGGIPKRPGTSTMVTTQSPFGIAHSRTINTRPPLDGRAMLKRIADAARNKMFP